MAPSFRPARDSLARGGAVEPEDYDLGFHDLGRPGEHGEAGRHSDLLRALRSIGDHAAGDRAAEVLAPELLACGRIERIEVAADIAEEHDATGRRRHRAYDWIVGVQAPLPGTGVSVDGIDPSGPVVLGTALFAEHVERIECRHSDPWLAHRNQPKFFDA